MESRAARRDGAPARGCWLLVFVELGRGALPLLCAGSPRDDEKIVSDFFSPWHPSSSTGLSRGGLAWKARACPDTPLGRDLIESKSDDAASTTPLSSRRLFLFIYYFFMPPVFVSPLFGKMRFFSRSPRHPVPFAYIRRCIRKCEQFALCRVGIYT